MRCFLVRSERRCEKIEVVVDGGIVCELIDMRARLVVCETRVILKDEWTLSRNLS